MFFRLRFRAWTVQYDLFSFGLGVLVKPFDGQFVLIAGPIMVEFNP